MAYPTVRPNDPLDQPSHSGLHNQHATDLEALQEFYATLAGGDVGEVLAKTSGDDYDYDWLPGGTGGGDGGDYPGISTEDPNGLGLGTDGGLRVEPSDLLSDNEGQQLKVAADDGKLHMAYDIVDAVPEDDDTTYSIGDVVFVTGPGDGGSPGQPDPEWIDFTPTWNNVTVGNASENRGWFMRVGNIVYVEAQIILGSTSAVTGSVELVHPVKPPMFVNRSYVGTAKMQSATRGTFTGPLENYSGFVCVRVSKENSGYIAVATTKSDVPFAWGDGDHIFVSYSYAVTGDASTTYLLSAEEQAQMEADSAEIAAQAALESEVAAMTNG